MFWRSTFKSWWKAELPSSLTPLLSRAGEDVWAHREQEITQQTRAWAEKVSKQETKTKMPTSYLPFLWAAYCRAALSHHSLSLAAMLDSALSPTRFHRESSSLANEPTCAWSEAHQNRPSPGGIRLSWAHSAPPPGPELGPQIPQALIAVAELVLSSKLAFFYPALLQLQNSSVQKNPSYVHNVVTSQKSQDTTTNCILTAEKLPAHPLLLVVTRLCSCPCTAGAPPHPAQHTLQLLQFLDPADQGPALRWRYLRGTNPSLNTVIQSVNTEFALVEWRNLSIFVLDSDSCQKQLYIQQNSLFFVHRGDLRATVMEETDREAVTRPGKHH